MIISFFRKDSYATNATTKSHYGQVPDVFILDNVECTGNENSLFECPHVKEDDCGPSEGAGAVCVNTTTTIPPVTLTPPTVELRGGPTSLEGNLFLNSKPVCDDGWGLNDANVACKMLLG